MLTRYISDVISFYTELACVSGVRKGRGRELGRETTRFSRAYQDSLSQNSLSVPFQTPATQARRSWIYYSFSTLFEAGRLLTFSAFSMGAYSRWALIRGWELIRINTVLWIALKVFSMYIGGKVVWSPDF